MNRRLPGGASTALSVGGEAVGAPLQPGAAGTDILSFSPSLDVAWAEATISVKNGATKWQ